MLSLCRPADAVTVWASRCCDCVGQQMLSLCKPADAVTVWASSCCHCVSAGVSCRTYSRGIRLRAGLHSFAKK
ncbi:hypothetical protein RRG08_045606 [Elysia crispata]|uniref:Uncharacterized protein n=1 Tax=Elysia crispata TaxID=231223 RepID=A0AAE1DXP8_9GAST|nr:hypothetical protein RRG08_045606 [Elysia crispata]